MINKCEQGPFNTLPCHSGKYIFAELPMTTKTSTLKYTDYSFGDVKFMGKSYVIEDTPIYVGKKDGY